MHRGTSDTSTSRHTTSSSRFELPEEELIAKYRSDVNPTCVYIDMEAKKWKLLHTPSSYQQMGTGDVATIGRQFRKLHLFGPSSNENHIDALADLDGDQRSSSALPQAQLWFEDLTFPEQEAMINRLAELWKYKLSEKGEVQIVQRIFQQLSHADAETLLNRTMHSDEVKEIIAQTEEDYHDPELDEVVQRVVKKGHVPRAIALKFTVHALRHGGIRGLEPKEMARHVLTELSRMRKPGTATHHF